METENIKNILDNITLSKNQLKELPSKGSAISSEYLNCSITDVFHSVMNLNINNLEDIDTYNGLYNNHINITKFLQSYKYFIENTINKFKNFIFQNEDLFFNY